MDMLFNRNKEYCKGHVPSPTLQEMRSSGQRPPKVCIICCIDPRADPRIFLQMRNSGEAAILTNVGGRSAKSINDVILLNSLVQFEEIVVIHHTDCGALHFTDAGIISKLRADLPGLVNAEPLKFGSIASLEESIKQDVALLKESPFIKDELAAKITGYIFDIKTGELRQAND